MAQNSVYLKRREGRQMNKCTCNKLNCDSNCLCACHRESERDELLQGLLNIEEAVDKCIARMQQYQLKK